MTRKKGIVQCNQHADLAAIHDYASQAGHLKSELLLDKAECVLILGTDMSLLQAEACG